MRLRAGKRRAKSATKSTSMRLTWEDLPSQERFRRQAHDAFRRSGLGRHSDRAGRAGNAPSAIAISRSCLWRFASRRRCRARTALYALIGQIAGRDMVMPVGLPWIGAHFRLDALSAFFLVVVNLGGAARKPLRARLWQAREGAAARAALLPAVSCRHEPGRRRRRAVISCSPGCPCRSPPGHWSWRTIRSRGTCTPARLSADRRAWAGSRCFSLSACSAARMAPTLLTQSARAEILGVRRARAHSRFNRRRFQGRSRAASPRHCGSPTLPRRAMYPGCHGHHDQGSGGLCLRAHRCSTCWATGAHLRRDWRGS